VKKVKININGKEVEAYLINKVYERKRKRKIGKKEYSWNERYIVIYLPSSIECNEFLLIPKK